MPAWAAASTSESPLGTVISRSLIVSVTVLVSVAAISRCPPRRRPRPRRARPARTPPARPPARARPRAPGAPRRGTRSSRHSGRLVLVVVRRERAVLDERAAALVDVALELLPEARHERSHRHRHRVAQRAEALAEDPVAHVQQQVELVLAGIAHLDPAQDLLAPSGALAAGRALA